MIFFGIKLIILRSKLMFQLSEFVWTPPSSIWVVLNHFLLTDATDWSTISCDQNPLFFAVILYPISFSETIFKIFISWIYFKIYGINNGHLVKETVDLIHLKRGMSYSQRYLLNLFLNLSWIKYFSIAVLWLANRRVLTVLNRTGPYINGESLYIPFRIKNNHQSCVKAISFVFTIP